MTRESCFVRICSEGKHLPQRTLASLGALVRDRRGARKLRETAAEIGISPATLLRVESGRIPDVVTFGKLCKWSKEDPKSFLGLDGQHRQERKVDMSAHFKADRHSNEETIQALAQMLLLAANPPIEDAPV